MSSVTVQIVTYNSGPSLSRCLRSVIDQEFLDFEVRVYDNASGDESREVVRSLGLDLQVSPVNLGYSKGHNHLLESSQAQYLVTVNPDAWIPPGYLREVIGAMEAHPACGSASGCLMRVDHLGEEPQSIDSTGLQMGRNRRQRLRHEGLPVANRPQAISAIFGPDGAAAVYRRDMLEDIRCLGEVFDEDFYIHKEDVDVAWRARLRGWESICIPTAVAHHVRSFRPGVRQRVQPIIRQYASRNRYLLMLKNEIAAHFLRDLWAIAPYDAGIFGYLTLFERSSYPGFRFARTVFPRMMAKRRVIQSRRVVEWRDLAVWFR
jgi:GT2 family glycosyltransferase